MPSSPTCCPCSGPRYRAALAEAFEDIPVVAAAHWRAAHRLAEARDASLAAGRIAMDVEAPQDAIESLELVLGLPATGDGGPVPPMPDAEDERPAGDDATYAPDGDAWTAIAQLAAEAAYAAMRPTRAVAYAESVLASLGERRDRTAYAVLQARLGRYRVAAGDGAGATSALRKAAGVVPAEPSLARARILALLAQERMIAGAFSDSERAASEALHIARGLGDPAEPEAIHAMTTLAVVRAWGDDPEEGVRLLRQAIERARDLGLVEEWWRAGANMAVVLELLGRPGEAIDQAFRDMDEARAMDLDAVYANLLGGNVAGILVDVGRWREARELSLRALDWSPAGVPFVNAILNLVIVEIESEAGEEAGRLLGRVLVELETGGDFQFAVPAYQATASYAMWSGDLADARRAAERGWARVRGTEDWVLMARMAATALEVESAIVAEALEKRRIGDVAASRERAGRILAEADAAVARARVDDDGLGRTEPDASIAAARAFHGRLQGRDDQATWAELAGRWHDLGDPYREGRARWRQAEAILGGATAGVAGSKTRTDARVVRADAREPLAAAVELALRLHARPLLRALRQLAGRALIQLPAAVDEVLAEPAPAPSVPRPVVTPGPVSDAGAASTAQATGTPAPTGDTFGLSKRELEVLALIARGPDQSRDRRPAVHQPEDRRRPRRQHPVQARRLRPGRGGGGRDPPRARGRRAAARRRVRLGAVSPHRARPATGVSRNGYDRRDPTAVCRGFDAPPPHRRPRRPVPRRSRVRRVDPARLDLCPAHAQADARALGIAGRFGRAVGAPAASAVASAVASAEAGASAPAGSGAAGAPVVIEALSLEFKTPEVSAPADAPFTIEFRNGDAGIQHNVEIKDASGASVFRGDIVTGVTVATYNVPQLAAGTYPFVCSVHPNMTGTLKVGG